MSTIRHYFSLVKFSHTIFALPFALIGFFLACVKTGLIEFTGVVGPKPGWHTTVFPPELLDQYKNLPGTATEIAIRFALVLLCMITARSAAMAFNRWLDKNFDAKNPRTAIREIPAGIVSANSALIFVVVNAIIFIASTWFINPICFYLSPVALFVILFYSYTKRFTPLCHLVLGLGLSLAPIGAYLAVTGRFDLLPVLFSFTVLCWVSGFDIIYALQDVEFDRENNLYSIPAVLGKKNALHVSELLHLFSAALVIAAGLIGSFGMLYWFGAAIFSGMLIYQHAIVKPDDLRRVNLAFMTANGIASIVFACFVLADLFLF
ncbi:4-hydroxybenzoate octaprenyltransferase [Segetibacter sp. 3557_3]|uniref:UbiA-like polyprenyltransferase n=1 Tax=Segetibacter sp. 3557_3 TaxID=2547429 RepID=UPI0010590E7B|nr:UbiA-like polyprenyltransferase [Segetibacter sp. 3557_3]TDH27392.1 4-hydroxybenzoate octaprenyltransferase [Segetibacter sp. 3557_3]